MFPQVRLGDIAKVVSGYAFKSSAFKEGGAVPVLKIKNIKIGTASLSDAGYVSEDYQNRLERKFHVFPGDILISLTGSHMTQPNSVVGRVGRYPKNNKKALLNQRAGKVIPDSKLVNADFLFYVLMQQDVRKEIAQMASGAASQANISPSQIESIEVPLPALSQQKEIGELFACYDNLIENNNSRIAILEKMAQSLYREWFVKFRFPGHQTCQFKDSPLGQIPEGWEVKILKDVLELAYGKALKKEYRRGGDVAVYGSGGLGGWHDESLVKGPSIIVGRKGNVGSVFWVDEDCWPIDTVFYVKSDFSKFFLYYNLLFQIFHNSDAAVPGLNRESAYSNKLIFPEKSILDNFNTYIEPLFGQLKVLRKKTVNLKEQRDMLLPKLISGQIQLEH